ncbi:phosphopentomutase [Rubellimicrobium aerolatum]|uniref:Phosphopentomutase n=1 Tax=Rubellimicrobium aerolatum TaxID=490979 RepID=A0ABW0SB34_9RHOB|nr:phosphopentomutase [Rubellimicrobium aerolatum]MBP1805387.1 phosphopentomutase [Rubellimicrobium aerolatum]
MTRAFLVVMDSVGVGGAPDAGQYFNGDRPDTGANTVGHIAEAVGLNVPVLASLGLWRAVRLASGLEVALDGPVTGAWGAATEVSRGKDTPSGHWELAGVPVPWDWTYFPKAEPAFPPDLVAEVCRLAGTAGILGNRHASGTAIIDELGAEHLRTGWPICYTSVDSVFQIAAHEERFGRERLVALCEALAPRLHAMKVGRVIARPFVGEPGAFRRTPHRRDFAIAPPAPTLCDWVQGAGRRVHAVGKIGDIFSMRGIDTLAKGPDRELMGHLHRLGAEAEEGALVFANFVEFDTDHGHRRDAAGYARQLEWFDRGIGTMIGMLREGDLLVVTADHGNDPTWTGTDHTRERVPVLMHGVGARELGLMGFADVGASVAAHLGVPAEGPGRSVL